MTDSSITKTVKIFMIKTLREYQRYSVDQIWERMREGVRNPLVVAPCGAGKSLMISSVIKEAIEQDPSVRILVLTHRKELLQQNEEELRGIMPLADTGFFSAGIGRKDTVQNIIFAGIQSIANAIDEFDAFDLVIIDECHLVPTSDGTRYQQVKASLIQKNEHTTFIGFTATPYRMDQGWLTDGDGALFDEIVADIPVQYLIDEGFLVPVHSREGDKKADLTGVKKTAGDFNLLQMAQAFETGGIIEAACAEIRNLAEDKRAWLIFTAKVDHAFEVRDDMRAHDIDAELITGETAKEDRDRIISDFKAGRLQCLVNVDVLTTGFNATIADCCVLLRATMSTAKYVQMVGRVMRTHEGKKDALLLDYGDNVMRHGPIDRVDPKRQSTGDGEAPAKKCPECKTIVHAACRECENCGYVFPKPDPNHGVRASKAAVLAAQEAPVWVDVLDLTFALHKKEGSPDSIRVTYACDGVKINEWICPEHGGFAGRVAASKLGQRWGISCQETYEALSALESTTTMPQKIKIKKRGNFWDIKSWSKEMQPRMVVEIDYNDDMQI